MSRRPVRAAVAAVAVATALAVGAVGVVVDQAPIGERDAAAHSMFQRQMGSGPPMFGPHWHDQDFRSNGDFHGH